MANYIEYIKVGAGESWPVRDKEAQEKLDNIVDLVYPVGSIYMSINGDVSPDTLFGGTWERIQDRFLLAAGSAYEAGTTGGEAEHTLTVDEIPRHKHGWKGVLSREVGDAVSQNTHIAVFGSDNASGYMNEDKGPQYEGGSAAHNNMPPYLAVYMWKRIS